MTTDTEALICDCPAKNMPFGRCCKLEPLTALRAAFESTVSEWGWDTYRNKAGDYATTSTNGAWAGYQAGHNWDDCPLVAVHEGAITHWMPLPASPDAIRAEPKEPSDG